ncbi:hypothetical protein FOA52_004262 [Chlamydomonas sp. UWO 241]|nr:hypothetical protein FOA52_004262 [Chlamydomonas sp. UWO 241]
MHMTSRRGVAAALLAGAPPTEVAALRRALTRLSVTFAVLACVRACGRRLRRRHPPVIPPHPPLLSDSTTLE